MYVLVTLSFELKHSSLPFKYVVRSLSLYTIIELMTKEAHQIQLFHRVIHVTLSFGCVMVIVTGSGGKGGDWLSKH